MDIILVIIIFGVVSYFRNKKKREEQERKRRAVLEAQQPSAAQNQYRPAYSTQQPPARIPDPRFPDYESQTGPQTRPQRPASDPRFPDYQPQTRPQRPASDPRFPDYQPQTRPQRPASDPRFPDYQPQTRPQTRPQRPAPDPRFPELEDVLIRGAEGLRSKISKISNAMTDAQARNLQEQLDELNRRKREAERKRENAPVPHSHMESHMESHVGSHMESHVESHVESHAQERLVAPPQYSMHTAHDNRSAGEGPPPRREQARREQPRPAPAQGPAQTLHRAIASISRDRNVLLQSIVMGEILGKPKALRR